MPSPVAPQDREVPDQQDQTRGRHGVSHEACRRGEAHEEAVAVADVRNLVRQHGGNFGGGQRTQEPARDGDRWSISASRNHRLQDVRGHDIEGRSAGQASPRGELRGDPDEIRRDRQGRRDGAISSNEELVTCGRSDQEEEGCESACEGEPLGSGDQEAHHGRQRDQAEEDCG